MGREDASLQDFYEASAYLTGYDEMALRGTGLGPAYLDTIRGSKGGVALDAVVARALDIGRAHDDPMKRAEALTELVDDASIGSLAKDVVVLWFLGTWQGKTVSDAAYVEGLVWNDMGAHPQAAKWPGWGTWAWKPRGTWA